MRRLRRLVVRPATGAANAAPAARAGGRERASDLLAVDPAWVGETYEVDDVLPMIALENEILRRRLDEALDRAEALAVAPADAGRDTPGDDEDADDAESPEVLAERYLAGQPSEGAARRHLVVANDYPDVGREYGNGFVHRRIRHYQDAGIHVDVVLAAPSLPARIYEYDGVRVLSGHGPEITAVLQRQRYHSASVHFLNELMWTHLEPFAADLDIHVFLHGYECDRWIRRVFNFASSTELERGIDRTLRLQRFWRRVTRHTHQPKSYIFVSEWWRRAVTDDMGVVFPAHRTRIVHNFIDTDLFDYVPKPDEQRFKILWVRSAASRKYGNDIAIDILRRLADGPFWDRVEATIIGDGIYFPEFEDQLGHHPNVTIVRRFVSQEEVAALHKTHGLLLVPSRLDSQGVSRDEGMSSGLVPVTNLVTAIPEFVDADCAIVAGAEDAESLAAGMERVMADPEEFQRLSRAAMERADRQCGAAATVLRELEIMGLTAPAVDDERDIR
ncbi:glycosyltransferase family 4 protein [Micrococcus sp. NPDC055215]